MQVIKRIDWFVWNTRWFIDRNLDRVEWKDTSHSVQQKKRILKYKKENNFQQQKNNAIIGTHVVQCSTNLHIYNRKFQKINTFYSKRITNQLLILNSLFCLESYIARLLKDLVLTDYHITRSYWYEAIISLNHDSLNIHTNAGSVFIYCSVYRNLYHCSNSQWNVSYMFFVLSVNTRSCAVSAGFSGVFLKQSQLTVIAKRRRVFKPFLSIATLRSVHMCSNTSLCDNRAKFDTNILYGIPFKFCYSPISKFASYWDGFHL